MLDFAIVDVSVVAAQDFFHVAGSILDGGLRTDLDLVDIGLYLAVLFTNGAFFAGDEI